MPLKQSMLSFKAASSPSSVTALPPMPSDRSTRTRPSPSSSNDTDGDTIVVDVARRHPLPTPSETATDTSSESSQLVNVENVSRGQAKYIKGTMVPSQDGMLDTVEGAGQSRSVSGETLVQSTSQSSLLKSGITALNLPWSMSSVFGTGSKGNLIRDNPPSMSTDSLDAASDDEEDQAKEEMVAARREKTREKARLRAEKLKAADKLATRRSSRASMLGKAGDMMSDIANNVLGKRPRNVFEAGKDRLQDLAKRTSLRPRSMMNPSPATTPAFDGPINKKRRMSEGDVDTAPAPEESLAQRRRMIQKRTDKRWLTSGLYIGQDRAFNGRLKESQNKKKRNSKGDQPQKENTVLPLPMFAGERLLKHGRDFKLPFDVFSPLPAGQPKPDEWRKTNKNVFIGDAGELWRTHKYQEHSTCMCRPETGCDNDCMNRFMYYECDEKNCNLTEEQCGNRAFEGLKRRAKKGDKYNVGVEVIKTADRGYGVRSNRTFDAHQIIVEYTGEIITQEECEDRMHSIYKENECYYLMLFDQNMIIDATRGSIARFVNHSCEPNCRMEKWTVGGKPRMALFAGDNGIMTGEELTYDYNFDPYSQKNVQECRCGAKNCRGVLGPKPKDGPRPRADDEEKARPESRLAGAKRKIAQVLDESTGRLNKKRKVAVVEAKVSSPALRVNKKVKLSKEVPTKSSGQGVHRSSSKLRRIINGARDEHKSKRVTSGASGQALMGNKTDGKGLGRTPSVRARAQSIRQSVARTVRGATSGKERIVRHVEDEEDD